MTDKISDNDIKKALEELVEKLYGAIWYQLNKVGTEELYKTANNALDLINRLEAEKKELQELVDDMGDYFPACIDCEGKTPLGERTDKCVYKLNNTNYCTKRGIATIFSIRNENRELKAENERLKEENQEQDQAILNTLRKVRKIRLDAYKEFAERLKEYATVDDDMTWWVANIDVDKVLKEMVGEDK